MKNNKGYTPLVVLLIIIGAVAIGGIAYCVGKKSAPKNKVVDSQNDISMIKKDHTPPNTSINNENKLPVETPIKKQTTTLASVNGKVSFGKGDCLPCAGNNCPTKHTYPYNGTLYFVKVSDLNNLSNGASHTTLFSNSPSINVNNGSYYSSTIPLGDYYALIQETYSASPRNQFTLQTSGQNINKDLGFFQCTSY